MVCSTPGFPVLHYLLKFAQTHVHWIGDAIQLSHSLSPPSPAALNLSATASFPVSRLLASGDQSIGASASASVHPVTTQSWFPLGWLDLLAVQGPQESSPAPQSESIDFSALCLLYHPSLIYTHGYWKKGSFYCMKFCLQSDATKLYFLSLCIQGNIISYLASGTQSSSVQVPWTT